jgi:hypothetical protein
VRVAGTDTIDRAELLRNNEVIRSAAPATDVCEREWADDTPLPGCALPPHVAGDRPFVFSYVRLVQANRQRAWASPIWLTESERAAAPTWTVRRPGRHNATEQARRSK